MTAVCIRHQLSMVIRLVLKTGLAIGVSSFISIATAASARSALAISADQLPPWSKGYLYIHFISTGRGNSSYVVMPDGTTMLIDAGETDQEFIKAIEPYKPFPPRPNADHDAGYWIADYVREFAPHDRPVALDYALITHFHTDHMGYVLPSSPISATGAYQMTGITEVGDLIPIKTLVDRAAPNYDVPVDLRTCHSSNNEKALTNYLKMVDYRRLHGQAVVGVDPGALDQISLKHRKEFPDFHIRNIAASGVVWTGRGAETQRYIPADAVKDCNFSENPFSIVIKLTYGKFSYFAGGDIPGFANYNQPWWYDMETPVAAVVGPVDVMTLDHHGNRDAVNGNILRALKPRVIIQQNWLSAQPGEDVVVRLASHEFYDGPRDVFATGMAPESRVAYGPMMDSVYKSYGGHVVIRVAPHGKEYDVYVLDDTNTRREILKHFGPYN
ncbi:MAG: MBL fold metallo-hydrolase [Alphaproteobacteria bacterium]|nr:MBL fold metallo-hydrolase [Alphaproteobacteria bacterium]MDE2492941.1 MBL fold metallo-hydrolase [Alphaproteobacteria bacterium]